MRVELTKFRVKEGKSKRVDEWIEYIHENMDDVLLNLEGERMYVETIFREAFNNVEYLYWYSVQDDQAGDDDGLTLPEIDKTHLEFFDECIDRTFRPEDMTAAVTMIPYRIRKAMESAD